MQRLDTCWFLVGMGALLAAVRLDAQTLPAAFRLEEEETVRTQDWARRAGGPAEGGAAEAGSRARIALEFSDVATTADATRALLTVVEYKLEAVYGTDKPVTRVSPNRLAGCSVRVRWGADGRIEMERLEAGTLVAQDRESLRAWTLEEVTCRAMFENQPLNAGDRCALPPEKIAPQLVAPAGAPPGITDWQERAAPPAGEILMVVESLEGDLAAVRLTGNLSSARTVSGKAGDQAVSGAVTSELSLEGTFKVDRRRRMVIERNLERRLQVTGRVGDTEWRHTETGVGSRRITPRVPGGGKK